MALLELGEHERVDLLDQQVVALLLPVLEELRKNVAQRRHVNELSRGHVLRLQLQHPPHLDEHLKYLIVEIVEKKTGEQVQLQTVVLVNSQV